ncbi:MAG: hypothetical protein A2035_01680 [Nitrospirae bacterium GWA2_42_11]|nr:MAG: hypothetical protein A2035_01680 [Nitrospirae bacterium GWA2_42_11]
MNMKITGERIYLRILTPEDVNKDYVEWLRDEEITQFLEIRWKVFTLEEIRGYVSLMNESPDDFLFGIFLKGNNEHIGNIKVGEINQMHRFGSVGLLIGNKNMWGKGYGTEAIRLATQYSFEEFNLNHLKAGMYSDNKGCYKAFIKAGYREVGRYKNSRFYKGVYVDEILLERIKNERLL